MTVERLVDRFLISQVDLRAHRPRNPAKRRWTVLINVALVQGLREEIRDQAAERFAFLLLSAFEITQDGRVNIDRGARHDALMINVFASDVKRLQGGRSG